MPRAVASIRKEERTGPEPVLSLHREGILWSLLSIWQLQGRSHAVLLGRPVAGHQLVLHRLWFIFSDSSFFFLSDCSFCFLCSHPLGLPTAVSGTGSQQSPLLSQSLLSRLFNCAEDHVTSIPPNNSSLWGMCSWLPRSFQKQASEERHKPLTIQLASSRWQKRSNICSS